ncbi:MAG: hypothetical protein LRZ84_18505 [Desertifilum sp.]|nr:hypothetical protein [Desertifilum sp.]NES94676.1 hypothetical protein [Desertifilum sp. SIO1I2]
MEITTDDYQVGYIPETATFKYQGFLRLNGMEAYQPIIDLMLNQIQPHEKMTLDLRELEFLNSSGISMLSMFVVKVRQMENVQLVLLGSNQVLWQTKSLKNLQRLMPSLKLEFS